MQNHHENAALFHQRNQRLLGPLQQQKEKEKRRTVRWTVQMNLTL